MSLKPLPTCFLAPIRPACSTFLGPQPSPTNTCLTSYPPSPCVPPRPHRSCPSSSRRRCPRLGKLFGGLCWMPTRLSVATSMTRTSLATGALLVLSHRRSRSMRSPTSDDTVLRAFSSLTSFCSGSVLTCLFQRQLCPTRYLPSPSYPSHFCELHPFLNGTSGD